MFGGRPHGRLCDTATRPTHDACVDPLCYRDAWDSDLRRIPCENGRAGGPRCALAARLEYASISDVERAAEEIVQYIRKEEAPRESNSHSLRQVSAGQLSTQGLGESTERRNSCAIENPLLRGCPGK
jgi:hypothetical protein